MATWRLNIDLGWSVASGSPGTNSWYYRSGAGGEDSGLADATEDLRVFYNAIKSIYPNAVTITCDGLWSGATEAAEGDSSQQTQWQITGSGGTGWAPPGLAMTAERRATSGGRRGKGRVFLGPLQGAVIGPAGDNSTNFATTVQTALNVLLAQDGNPNGSFALVSKVDGLVRDIASGQVKSKFAMVRSRRD